MKDLTVPGNTVNFSFKDNKLYIGFFWKFIREALINEFERNRNLETHPKKDHSLDQDITKE
jgi:hypothetical protein